MIAAFRAMPSCPIYRQGPRFKTVTGQENTLTSVLAWDVYLRHDPDARKYLWAWASCKAKRESFSEMVLGNGWKRSTVEAARRRGADTIAKRLGSTTSSILDIGKTGNGASAATERDVVLA